MIFPISRWFFLVRFLAGHEKSEPQPKHRHLYVGGGKKHDRSQFRGTSGESGEKNMVGCFILSVG